MARGGARSGAGRPGRETKVEDCLRLDVRQLQRADALEDGWCGVWWWRAPDTEQLLAEVRLRVSAAEVRVTYQCGDMPIDEWISLVRLPCPLGGARPQFLCPGCCRRATILLLCEARFRCRCCHDLPYRSQSEGAMDRAFRAQWKKEDRLDPHGGRPKGMHDATYRRLRSEIIAIKASRLPLLYALLR